MGLRSDTHNFEAQLQTLGAGSLPFFASGRVLILLALLLI